MRYKGNDALKKNVISVIIILVSLSYLGCASSIRPEGENPNQFQMPVVEKYYSDDMGNISIGIANKINVVSTSGTASIEENKQNILKMIDVFKEYSVNMVLFPEFSLTGYFWEDSPECWNYMKKGLTDAHLEWLAKVKAKLDDNLQYIVFNNIRLNPDAPNGKFLNSTYIIDQDFDCTNLNSESNERFRIYDKTFLPGIENTFTKSGKTDILVLETQWGKFGFTTCYDMSFTQIFQGYAMFDKVDAIVQIASWRGTSKREYPGMNVASDHYYGFIWDLMAASQAAFNQVWVIASNAVGTQKLGDYEFWGGSGIWAPSGMVMVQGSQDSEELIIVHNVDIRGQTKFEHDDFYYYEDFIKIYDPLKDLRTFTRMN